MSFSDPAQPEPAGAPARSRAETRRRLVAAATELFSSAGLQRTTSTRIARAAGVAAGTFYLHFPDKRALFREIAFDALAQLRARLARASERAGPDPEAALRARMEELVTFAEERRSLVRILFGRGEEAAALGQDLLDALFPGVEARLRQLARERRFDPRIHPGAAARALLAMWSQLVAWWIEDPRRVPRAALVETLVALHPQSRPPRGGA
jgi:AcrR family transcriptional regulator